jgi:cell fate regulator YaaT (PSP1 superfamily)
MPDELKMIHYNDVMTDLASCMEEVGCRTFLRDFRTNYPKHFEEIIAQIHRLESRPVARLLDKDAPTV